MKSHRPKDEHGPPGGGGRNPDVDFHGEKRRRDTHESKTDKDALRFKKTRGSESKLAYLGHLLQESRHGLVVDAQVTRESTGQSACRLAFSVHRAPQVNLALENGLRFHSVSETTAKSGPNSPH